MARVVVCDFLGASASYPASLPRRLALLRFGRPLASSRTKTARLDVPMYSAAG